MRTAKDDRQGILRPLPARLAGTILRLARDAIVADKLMWWMQGEGRDAVSNELAEMWWGLPHYA